MRATWLLGLLGWGVYGCSASATPPAASSPSPLDAGDGRDAIAAAAVDAGEADTSNAAPDAGPGADAARPLDAGVDAPVEPYFGQPCGNGACPNGLSCVLGYTTHDPAKTGYDGGVEMNGRCSFDCTLRTCDAVQGTHGGAPAGSVCVNSTDGADQYAGAVCVPPTQPH